MFGGDHRSVTQSVAISPDITIWLYRRSCPDTVCSRDLNIDRFHRTCLQNVGQGGNIQHPGCGLSPTQHFLPLSLIFDMDGNQTKLTETDKKPASQNHSTMLIHSWSDTGAFSKKIDLSSPAL